MYWNHDFALHHFFLHENTYYFGLKNRKKKKIDKIDKKIDISYILKRSQKSYCFKSMTKKDSRLSNYRGSFQFASVEPHKTFFMHYN